MSWYGSHPSNGTKEEARAKFGRDLCKLCIYGARVTGVSRKNFVRRCYWCSGSYPLKIASCVGCAKKKLVSFFSPTLLCVDCERLLYERKE